MKIMFYALRPFDEQAYCEPYSKQYGIDYAPRRITWNLPKAAMPSAPTPA